MKSPEFPLLKRELVGLLRTKRAFWLLVSAVAISGVVLLLSWPSFWDSSSQSPRHNAGRFYAFVVTQLILGLVFTPAFTATAFTVEREERTFELLYSTLLSPFSIVFSKLLSSSGYLLILLVASAPVVSTLYLLGGFEFGTILKCYAIVVAALVSSALVCLTVSLRSAGTAQSMVRSFVWLLVWNGGLGLTLALVLAVGDELGTVNMGRYVPALLSLTPFSALFAAERMISDQDWPAYLYLGYAGVLSLGHLVYLVWKTRNPYAVFQTRRRKARRGKATGPRFWLLARQPLLGRLLVSLGEKEVRLVRNPVFQKEIRSEFFARALYRRLVFWTSLLLYALLSIAFWSAWNSAWFHAVATINLFLVLALVPAVASTSITREREKGNLDFLRSSLLTPVAILGGKFLSAIYSNFGLLAALTLVSGCSVMLTGAAPTGASGHSVSIGLVLLVVSMTLLILAFVAALSLLASVTARRSVGALLLSYGAVFFICIGLPVVLALTDLADLGDPFGLATQPFLAINSTIEGLTRRSGGPSQKHVATLVWFALIYGVGTPGLLWLAVRSGAARLARDR